MRELARAMLVVSVLGPVVAGAGAVILARAVCSVSYTHLTLPTICSV